MERIAIVGAGLVGSLEALHLAQRGYEVSVFEGRNDLRGSEAEGGRSINLALSDRGRKALRRVGLEEKVMEMAIPMEGRMIHPLEGDTELQRYGAEGQAIHSVSRSGLNRELLKAADDYDALSLHFEQKCRDLDLEKNELVLEDRQSGEQYRKGFDRIIGTDGAFSSVRTRLMKTDRFDYSQSFLAHGYKELQIPPGPNGEHRMHKNALHIWPRGSYMMIALPNPDGSFTCTLFLPFEGEPSFDSLDSDAEVERFFNENFPDAVPLMPTLMEDLRTNPTSSLVTVRCEPWHYQGKVLLMGDSAHAIVPFYGQGMNAGFEDCTVLERILEQHGDTGDAIEAFSKERKEDADAIADLALWNFIEMRDKTVDPRFQLRKKIEKRLHEKHPDSWKPLYSMVTFSHEPYSKALKEGQKQAAIMERIMERPDIEEKWDSEEVEEEALRRLREWESAENE
jgi:kynurenine 3-monooxygenase